MIYTEAERRMVPGQSGLMFQPPQLELGWLEGGPVLKAVEAANLIMGAEDDTPVHNELTETVRRSVESAKLWKRPTLEGSAAVFVRALLLEFKQEGSIKDPYGEEVLLPEGLAHRLGRIAARAKTKEPILATTKAADRSTPDATQASHYDNTDWMEHAADHSKLGLPEMFAADSDGAESTVDYKHARATGGRDRADWARSVTAPEYAVFDCCAAELHDKPCEFEYAGKHRRDDSDSFIFREGYYELWERPAAEPQVVPE